MYGRNYRMLSLWDVFFRLAVGGCLCCVGLPCLASIDSVVCWWQDGSKVVAYGYGKSVSSVRTSLRQKCTTPQSYLRCPLDNYDSANPAAWNGHFHSVALAPSMTNTVFVYASQNYYSTWTNESYWSSENASGWVLRADYLEMTRCARCSGYGGGGLYPRLGMYVAAFDSTDDIGKIITGGGKISKFTSSNGQITGVETSSEASPILLGDVENSSPGGGSSSSSTFDDTAILAGLDALRSSNSSGFSSVNSKIGDASASIVGQVSSSASSLANAVSASGSVVANTVASYGSSLQSSSSSIDSKMDSLIEGVNHIGDYVSFSWSAIDNYLPKLESISWDTASMRDNLQFIRDNYPPPSSNSVPSSVTNISVSVTNTPPDDSWTNNVDFSSWSNIVASTNFVVQDSGLTDFLSRLPRSGYNDVYTGKLDTANTILFGGDNSFFGDDGNGGLFMRLFSSFSSVGDSLTANLSTLRGVWGGLPSVVPHFEFDIPALGGGDASHFVLDFSSCSTIISWARKLVNFCLWLLFVPIVFRTIRKYF